MTNQLRQLADDLRDDKRDKTQEKINNVIFVLLLMLVACRCFLGELPFRTSAVQIGVGGLIQVTADYTELTRTVFVVAIFTLVAWFVGTKLAMGGAVLSHSLPLWLGCLYIFWVGPVTQFASDKWLAWLGSFEQLAYFGVCFLAIQLCADKRRFLILLVVLTGLAGAMTAEGLWQVFSEAPDRIEDFQLNRLDRFAEVGIDPNSPQAAAFEARLSNTAPFGFFSLTNVFASLIILLLGAAVALAVGKIASAIAAGRKSDDRKPGEIDPAMLAGILTAIMAVGAAVILALTQSRGAIGATCLVGLLGIVVFVLRKKLAPRWRTWVAISLVGFVLAMAAVVGHGLTHDSLPSKTMTFRWFYWTASAEIVKENPVLGVGPGNFPSAYLQHRRAAAEEEIKMPHNFLVHAAVQYGLPGAAIYLAIMAYVLAGACRPSKEKPAESDCECRKFPKYLCWLLPLVVCVLRIALANESHPAFLLFDAILPALAFGVCLVIAAWASEGLTKSPGFFTIVRISVVAGLVGFLLHNMVSISLWVPATATVFWVLAGAALGSNGKPSKVISARIPKWFSVALVAMSILSPGISLLYPTIRKVSATRAIATVTSPNDALLGKLAGADYRDPLSIADAARLTAIQNPGRGYRWAKIAINRDPANWSYHRLAARIAVQLAAESPGKASLADAVGHMADAIERNPADARVRIEYAGMLFAASQPAEVIKQLDWAERIEAQLYPESVEKFTPAERKQIEAVRQAALALIIQSGQ